MRTGEKKKTDINWEIHNLGTKAGIVQQGMERNFEKSNGNRQCGLFIFTKL